jgi:hypothetical protein
MSTDCSSRETSPAEIDYKWDKEHTKGKQYNKYLIGQEK